MLEFAIQSMECAIVLTLLSCYFRTTGLWQRHIAGKGDHMPANHKFLLLYQTDPKYWSKHCSIAQLLTQKINQYERRQENVLFLLELYPELYKEEIQQMVLDKFEFHDHELQTIYKVYPALACAMI